MSEALVIRETVEPGIARLTFNRPDKMNALSTPMLRLFEVDPVWCPQDAGIRAVLRTVDPALALTSADLPAVVDGSGWAAARSGAAADRPIAGTDLCDAGGWPADVRDAVALHHRLTDVDVRLRLPDRPKCTVELPRPWLTFAAGDLDPRPFLHQLDFYLHFPHQPAAELYSRPALQAAGLGCVVVLPERHAAQYGDAAVYCEPDAVPGLVRRYTASPGLYAEQSRRARAVVARAYHPDRFAAWIAALIHPGRNGVGDHRVTDEVTSHGGSR